MRRHSCPGNGDITIPGGVPECGGDVVLGDVVSGHGGLDMRILEVFSNQNLKGI